MDQDDQGGFLDKAKEAIGNLFGGDDTATSDTASEPVRETTDYTMETTDDVPSSVTGNAPEYKSGTDQDSTTGDYPTATGAGTGVAQTEATGITDWSAPSTSDVGLQYKSGTDQDSATGDYPTATGGGTGISDSGSTDWNAGTTGTSTWDASTDTEVVTPSAGFDTDVSSPVGATADTYSATSAESGYDAGAGTGSSLSGSDTSFTPTSEYGVESETVRRTNDEEILDQP